MPRVCTVCTHPKRAEIDNLLARQAASKRSIALREGLSHTSLNRHEARHLEPLLIEAHKRSLEAGVETAREVILEVVRDLREDRKACRGVNREQYESMVDRLIKANEQWARINRELGADQVNTFLIELGARSQDEVKTRLALSSGMDHIAPEEAQDEALQTLETVWRINPELRTVAMKRLERSSFAEVIHSGTNGTTPKAH